ncbi:hypothetical protein J437_LFUL003995, partial [Ladona fulva]
MKKLFNVFQNVPSNHFLPCLTELCKLLWGIIRSYHHIVNWHRKSIQVQSKLNFQKDIQQLNNGDTTLENSDTTCSSENKSVNVESEETSNESLFSNDYVMQKLEAGLTRIWNEVQSKICALLTAADLSWYKFDDFLQVLDLVHRLIEIGEEFCGSKSPELQDSVRAKSLEYVSCHHHTTLDELRIFLENEGWEICPVRPSFSILQLREYRFLRSHFHSQVIGVGSEDESTAHSTPVKTDQGCESYFTRYPFSTSGSPFDPSSFADEVQDEDILLDKVH